MTDYRAVMDLVLKGWSVRQITAAMGCSHSTVQKVRKVLQAEQITTTAQIAGLNDEAVAVLFHDGRSTGQGVFVPIDFDSVVKARRECPIVCVRGLGLQVVRESVGVSHG